jgi:hypothetical protein
VYSSGAGPTVQGVIITVYSVHSAGYSVVNELDPRLVDNGGLWPVGAVFC